MNKSCGMGSKFSITSSTAAPREMFWVSTTTFVVGAWVATGASAVEVLPGRIKALVDNDKCHQCQNDDKCQVDKYAASTHDSLQSKV